MSSQNRGVCGGRPDPPKRSAGIVRSSCSQCRSDFSLCRRPDGVCLLWRPARSGVRPGDRRGRSSRSSGSMLGQVAHDRVDAEPVHGQVAVQHHEVGEPGRRAVRRRSAPATRSRRSNGVGLVAAAQPLRGGRRVLVGVDDLERISPDSDTTCRGGTAGDEPQPGPQRLVPAHQEPQQRRHRLDRRARRQRHGPADVHGEPGVAHRLPDPELPHVRSATPAPSPWNGTRMRLVLLPIAIPF